jgi:4-amino-4-deoxy-L-arabinose transferase-like glycosyltransferase
MSRRTVIICLVLLSLLALAARVGTIVYLKAWQNPNAMEHRAIARNLVNGDGFSFRDWDCFGPTSVQSPPYPFLLAGLFKVFGTHVPPDGSLQGANLAFLAAMMLNALAGAATVALTYLLARTLGAGALAGLLAAAAVAVWPSQVYAARVVQAIALITAALLASIILFYRAVRSGKPAPWIGYSIIATLAALTEPVFLPALVISGGLVLIWRELAWKARLRNAAILMIAAIVIIGPWSLRNYHVHHKLVPIKSTFWVNVWKGNNDFATGTDRLALTDAEIAQAKAAAGKMDDADIPDGEHQYERLDAAQKARLQGQPEVVREEIFKEFTVNWIGQHPDQYLRLCGKRLLTTLTVDWDNPKSYNAVYIASRFLLLILTVLGLIVAWRQKWSLLLPGIIAGTALLTYTLTVTAARFSLPFEPLQLALGAALVALPFDRCAARGRGFPTVAPQARAPEARAPAPIPSR